MTRNEYDNLKAGDLIEERTLSNLSEIYAIWTVDEIMKNGNVYVKTEKRSGIKCFLGYFDIFSQRHWVISAKPKIVDLI